MCACFQLLAHAEVVSRSRQHWLVVDLRRCCGDVEDELFKYLIKDVGFSEGTLQLIDPTLAARIYSALEGMRALATSRGFRNLNERVCFCEASGSTSVTRRIHQESYYGVGGGIRTLDVDLGKVESGDGPSAGALPRQGFSAKQ